MSTITTPDLQAIGTAVHRVTGITHHQIRERSRLASISRARHLFCLLARELTPLSLVEIAEHLHGRDHATVLHSVRAARALVMQDPEFRRSANRARVLLDPQRAMLAIPPMPVPQSA